LIKMRKMFKAMKEKRRDKRTKKLEEKGLHYIQENEKLGRYIADLQGGNTVEMREEKKKNIKTGYVKNRGQLEDTVIREECNAEGDALQEENTLTKEKESEQLENEARQLMNYVTPYTLLPGQEKQWYKIITERVKTIQDKSVTEILSALVPHIVYHPEIEKRLRKQLEKSKKESFDNTIEQCLKKITKGYTSQQGLNQDVTNFEKSKELTSASRNNNNSLLISANATIVDRRESPDPARKVKKTIRKRCHCCKKRGHLMKNCPIRKMSRVVPGALRKGGEDER